MAKIMKPPVLMSRILTFVLAASIVVLAALVFVLAKMIPLERPEVFFLLAPTRVNNLTIEPLDTDNINNKVAISNYEKGFIRQYVIARNELYTNALATKSNWTKIVKPWSDKKVFSAFTKTILYKDYNFNDVPPSVSCSVNFSNAKGEEAVLRTNNGEYVVSFTWICKNIGGQNISENYKIRIKIQSTLDKDVSGTLENLRKLTENPLGIQVTEYTVLGGKSDPLNSDITP